MRTFVVTPSRSGLYGLLPRQDWQALVARSVDSWNQGLARCCSVRLSLAPAVDRRLAEQDNLNLVILRRGPWCHNERCGKASTFPLTVLGMTNTYPKDAVGAQVREADIEINATHLHHSPGAGWVSSVTAMPLRSFTCPALTTRSPAFSPLSTATRPAWVSPVSTCRRCTVSPFGSSKMTNTESP